MFNTGTAFKWAGRELAGAAENVAGTQLWRRAAGGALFGGARAMNWMGNSPYARSALLGGAAGGIYGAFDDRVGVLGGMGLGATAAMAGRGAWRGGRKLGGLYSQARKWDYGVGQSGAIAFNMMARDSSQFIRNKFTNAVGAVRGIPNRVRGWMA